MDQDTKIKETKKKYQQQFLLNFFLIKIREHCKLLYQILKKLFLQLTFMFEIPIDYSNKTFRLNICDMYVYYIIFIYS